MVGTELDLTKYCNSFPEVDEKLLIRRPHVLDAIESIFPVNNMVVLEGPDGIGKSTLAAEYAQLHCKSCICVFLGGNSRWGHDPELVRQEICEQLYVYLNGATGTLGPFTESDHRQMLFALRSRARSPSARPTFVIDGLADIPVSKPGSRQLITDLLPLDFDRCRFIFTSADSGTQVFPTAKPMKPYTIAAFSLDEAQRYLEPVVKDQNHREELFRLTRGIPSKLASVRRSLSRSPISDELLLESAKGYPELFELVPKPA